MGKADHKSEIDKTREIERKTVKSFENQFFQSGSDGGSGQWDSEIKALLDNFTLKSLFLTEDWVFILLDLMASEISDVDMKVARETFTPDGRNVVTWLDDHPLNKLIQKPNPNQDYSTWMYLHIVEYCLMGNAMQWYAESLDQLHILPAENIMIKMNEQRHTIDKYVIHSQVGNDQMGTMAFPPDQILHQRRPNPVSTLWGLSPFIPNSKALLFNRYTQDYLNAFYLKSATGQLALSLDKQTSEEAAMRLMRSFEHSYTGRRNTRRTMLLPKGVSVEQISQSITDQNLIEVVNQNRDKILNILRIPKHALSLAENGSLGSEEFKVSLKFMWTSSIKPTMKKVAGTFTDFFREKGLLKPDERFMFDLSHIELLREDSLKTADLAIKQLEFKTLNEVRKDLYDLEPLDGGDETPTLASKEGGDADSGSSSELEIEEDSASDIIETKDHPGDSRVKALMTTFGTWFEVSQKKIAEDVKKTESDMHLVALSVFTHMARSAVRDFRSVFKDKKSYGPKRMKAAEGSKEKLRKRLKESFSTVEAEFIEGFNDSLLPAVDTGYKTSVESVFNDNIRDRIEVLGDRDADRRKADLRSRSHDSFGHISDTTEDNVISIVESGISEGKTVDEMSVAIVAGFASFGTKRADTIARTESFTAVSIGRKSALDNATEIVPNMLKVWVNTGDAKVRGNPDGKYPNHNADHWVLQGEIVSAKNREGKDTTFSNGLRYPRDVNSSKRDEVINCRCDLMMVAPEDLDRLSIARP